MKFNRKIALLYGQRQKTQTKEAKTNVFERKMKKKQKKSATELLLKQENEDEEK